MRTLIVKLFCFVKIIILGEFGERCIVNCYWAGACARRRELRTTRQTWRRLSYEILRLFLRYFSFVRDLYSYNHSRRFLCWNLFGTRLERRGFTIKWRPRRDEQQAEHDFWIFWILA